MRDALYGNIRQPQIEKYSIKLFKVQIQLDLITLIFRIFKEAVNMSRMAQLKNAA